MNPSIYADDELVARLTIEAISKSGRILQFQKHLDDAEHVEWLLGIFDIPHNSRVLDVACGVGRVAEEMLKQRPDLTFGLLNISKSQLDMCPDIGYKFLRDMHDIPEGYDVVMVNYALGHADIHKFSQSCRKQGVKIVCIYEPLATENVDYLAHTLQYDFLHECDVLSAFGVNGYCGRSVWSSAPVTDYGVNLTGLLSAAFRLGKCDD